MGCRDTNRDWTVPAWGETPLYPTDGHYWRNCLTIIIERDKHCKNILINLQVHKTNFLN
jgi:hypothetical protein